MCLDDGWICQASGWVFGKELGDEIECISIDVGVLWYWIIHNAFQHLDIVPVEVR